VFADDLPVILDGREARPGRVNRVIAARNRCGCAGVIEVQILVADDGIIGLREDAALVGDINAAGQGRIIIIRVDRGAACEEAPTGRDGGLDTQIVDGEGSVGDIADAGDVAVNGSAIEDRRLPAGADGGEFRVDDGCEAGIINFSAGGTSERDGVGIQGGGDFARIEDRIASEPVAALVIMPPASSVTA
jgi:hypothetical protein